MTGETPDRQEPAGAAVVALLLGLGTVLACLWQGDPVSSILTSGLLTAVALRVVGAGVGLMAGAAFAATLILGFAAGGLVVGCITAAAVLAAWPYAWLHGRFPRDDDQFFLAPLCFWVLLAGMFGVALALGGELVPAASERLRGAVAMHFGFTRDSLDFVANLTPKPQDVFPWARSHVAVYAVSLAVGFQTLVAFPAIRSARSRLGWIDPLAGRFIRFRIHERYSLLLILGLALLVAGPYAKSARMQAFEGAVLTWFGTGCFLAGVASALFVVARLRQSGRWLAARMYLLGMLLVLLLQQAPAFAVIGLVDIWFDIRKLTPKKGEV